jgi:hypothetical protein
MSTGSMKVIGVTDASVVHMGTVQGVPQLHDLQRAAVALREVTRTHAVLAATKAAYQAADEAHAAAVDAASEAGLQRPELQALGVFDVLPFPPRNPRP